MLLRNSTSTILLSNMHKHTPPGPVPKEQADTGEGLKHTGPQQDCSCNFGCFGTSKPDLAVHHTPISEAKLETAIKAAAFAAARDAQRELQKKEERKRVIEAFNKMKASVPCRTHGDCCDGEGSSQYASGAEYEGHWKGGKQHGQGTYRFADKSTFVGQWVQGNMHGHGLYTYSDQHNSQTGARELFKSGDWYEGQFQCNNRHGQVCIISITCCDKAYYVVYPRKGTFNRPNDRSYVGQWRDDKKHGLGTCTIEGGDIYHGQYQNGEMEGRGILQ